VVEEDFVVCICIIKSRTEKLNGFFGGLVFVYEFETALFLREDSLFQIIGV